MNGTVVSSYLPGAQVQEEAQFANPATLEFVGAIRLVSASA
jgi:hypothetical protein